MRSYHLVWLLLVFFVAGVSVAQDITLTETYTFEGGATFQYPQDWTLKDDEPVSIASDQTRIFILDDAALRRLGVNPITALPDALHAYFLDQYPDAIFKRTLAEEVDLGGHAAARYPYTVSVGTAALLIATRFNDGNVGILDVVSLKGDLTEEDTVLAIAASFNRQAVVEPTAEVTATVVPEVNCTVSTTYANAVHVRVGPGGNRTAFAFLPTDKEFTVLGKAQASDDSLWWKLDKQEVAPKKSAAEAWVSELDVEESGNCDAVVDVNAPPVIPIVSAPPAGNTNGDSSGSNAGAVPGAGTWTIVYASTAPVSCLDNPGLTVQVPINIPPDTVAISQPGGSTLIFDGDTFTSPQPGVYQGLYNSLISSSNVVLTLRVISDSVMTVEFIYNDTIQGTQCSFTINGTATRN